MLQMKHLERLTVCIVILLTFQLMIMLVPLGTGAIVYVQNRETINAMADIDGRTIVEKVNMIKDIPIQNMSRNADVATAKLKDIMQQAHILADNKTSNVFVDIKRMIHEAVGPVEALRMLMNNKTNDSVFDLVHTVSNISHSVPLEIFAKGLHTLEDADKALEKMDKILGKFVN